MHLHLWIPTVHADALRAQAGLACTAPVAVATSAHPDAVILDATESARRAGVHAPMRLAAARARCPGLVAHAVDPALARRTQSTVAALCAAVSSAASGDAERWDLDLEGGPLPPPPPGATGWTDARSIARALARTCRDELGLDAWAGFGGSIGEARLAARLARAQGDPRAAAGWTPACAEREEGLPLSWLPDLPARAAARLQQHAITSIGALRALDATTLVHCLGSDAPLATAAAVGEDAQVLSDRGEPGPILTQGVWCGIRGCDPARAALLLAAAGGSLAARLSASGLACADVVLHARWIDPYGRSQRHRVRHHAVRDLAALAPTLARLDGLPVRWERFDLVACGLFARAAAVRRPLMVAQETLAAVA